MAQPNYAGGKDLPFNALGKCDAGICGPDTEPSGTLPCFNITCILPNGAKFLPGIVSAEKSPYAAAELELFRPTLNLAPVVALLTPGFQVLCTGTAIGPDAVLTAAHCACDPQAAVVYFGDKVPDPGDIGVDPQHPGFAFRVLRSDRDASTSFFAEYCTADDGRRHKLMDLGILRFDNEASASAFIASPSTQTEVGSTWTVAGFGVNDVMSAASTPEQQRLGGVKLTNSGIEVSDCLGPPNENCLPGNEWVSRPLPGTTNDTCNGDSGGPLFVEDAFVGVTRGRLNGAGTAFCGHGGIYTRLDSAARNERGETPLDWIARLREKLIGKTERSFPGTGRQ